MKILLLRWNAYNQYDIELALKNMGIYFDILQSTEATPNETDERFIKLASDQIFKQKYDAVLSVNYYELLSKLCHESGTVYLSWAYDSPLNIYDFKLLEYPTTYIFHFDKTDIDRLVTSSGSKQIYHLPLAVNVRRIDSYYISSHQRSLYKSDITFIGNLYKNSYNEIVSLLPDYFRGFFNSLYDLQMSTYGIDFLTPYVLSPDLGNAISPYLTNSDGARKEGLLSGDGQINIRMFRNIIYKNIAHNERVVLLELLSRYYSVKLYTKDRSAILKNVTICDSVDWKEIMPRIFKVSKLNLNISIRRILSGIPQRCLDIMGAGGFLLSNYQSELKELEDSGACILYQSIEEAFDKASFYLKHGEERQRIAETAHQIMIDKFRYEDRIAFMLEKAGISY